MLYKNIFSEGITLHEKNPAPDLSKTAILTSTTDVTLKSQVFLVKNSKKEPYNIRYIKYLVN